MPWRPRREYNMKSEAFEEWYADKRGVFVDFDSLPEKVEDFYKLQIALKYGVYQRFFLQKYKIMIYTKQAYDKFSIHIERTMNEGGLLNRSLINNNIDTVQEELVEVAFKKVHEPNFKVKG